jgi:vitamin B12 transporter
MRHNTGFFPLWWPFAVATLGCPPLLPAEEQSPGQAWEEIVVTATRLPTPRSRVASSTTVITAEDIARRQLRTVPQALKTVPGLHVVQSGGPGQQTSVFMRGANSNQTLVLIDGIEANDPSNPNGSMDLSNLLVDNIERIEIVRGPQSSLYGSEAIGGVINIITRKGKGRPSVTARLEAGSDNTVNPRAGLSGAKGSLAYSASFTYLNTDGHSVTPKRLRDGAKKESDSYRNWTGSTRFDWAPTETLEAGFVGRYIREDKTNTDPELEDEFGFGTTEDPDAFLRSDQYYLRGQGKAALLGGLWDVTLAVAYTDYDRKSRNDRNDPVTETLDRSNFEGDKLKFEWKNDLYLHEDHIVTAGLETEKETSKSNGFTAFGSFVIFQNTDADSRTSAFYLQDQFSIHERFFGNAGVRVDHDDDFGTEPTFRIAPVYLHKETRTRITGSIGTGFKAPSLNQRYGFTPTSFGTAFRGNPNLDAEKSLGWELGFEQPLWGGQFEFGATYFWSRIKDAIETVFLPDFSSTAVNLDEVHSLGVEAFMAAEPIPQLSLRVDYTYTKAEDDDGGAKLLRRPSHKVSGDIQYRHSPSAQISASISYVDDWVDIDRASVQRVTPRSYTVVDLAASYLVNDRLTLIGRVDNATDERYEPADGFEAPGRGYFGGFELRL